MKRPLTISLFLILFAIPVFADDFSVVVKNVESRHGIRRANPHLVGLASMIANPMIWGSDAERFQIASFENEDAASRPGLQDLDQIYMASLSSNWHPLFQLVSRKDGKATSIYTDFSGQNVRVLIGSIEGNAIGVVQMEVDEKAIARIKAGIQAGAQAAMRAKQKQ
jgi:hypothetical protein